MRISDWSSDVCSSDLENGGFIGIMRNFNSERLGMAMGCCAYARVAMAEAAEWAQNRETFGKPLVGHQSIRIKLADMERQIEATQAWVDLAAWQVKEIGRAHV